MKPTRDAFPAITLVTLLACGDNTAPSCDPVWQLGELNREVDGCYPALIFASRDTADLLPSQEEVDRYLDRWQRTIIAEPVLAGRYPQRYRVRPDFTIYTTNPTFIDAWSRKVLLTGDIELDEMLARIDAKLPRPARDVGSMHSASINTRYVFNEEVLEAALVARSSWMTPAEMWPQDDGAWFWLDTPERVGHDGATAQIDFRFGWGDCFAGCLGFRNLRAIVPAVGPATVYDLGGNELPPHLSLSPNTKPPP